jgi:hypothetical protein
MNIATDEHQKRIILRVNIRAYAVCGPDAKNIIMSSAGFGRRYWAVCSALALPK